MLPCCAAQWHTSRAAGVLCPCFAWSVPQHPRESRTCRLHNIAVPSVLYAVSKMAPRSTVECWSVRHACVAQPSTPRFRCGFRNIPGTAKWCRCRDSPGWCALCYNHCVRRFSWSSLVWAIFYSVTSATTATVLIWYGARASV